ncbi:hypothetical protein KCU81_g1749, partial [Aureobasidium melanogenum]|uniref:DUF7918 domain-containing protein n=1 Tax=Aureobasidium melanogenum (strain CBS 110374) TaxID=1043003 RepID=A0A074VTU3_AURM1
MPSLKQLTCSIELGSTHTKVPEYGKDYGDGHVTSYIAVPSEEVNFSVHLTSHGYIAPGLAMFVYMDGQYQCNRNRRGLIVPGKGVKSDQTEVDLRVRQKETKQPDGSFLGRDWTFHGLNLVSADKVEETDDVFLENLGTIEVIVLRCKDAPPPPPSEPVSRQSSSRATVESSSRSVSKSTPKQSVHQEQKEPSKPSSSSHKQKEPSAKAKAPSKPASAKPASAKPASVKSATAKESSFGGLFGLFDGASDEPDHDGINPKSYWNDWNKRPVMSSYRPARALYIAPEESMPLVPKQAARAKHVEHQVKTGKGAPYLHLCARPEYLDSMQQPYAVFTFKYRSKKVIEKKFKIEIKEEGKALKAKLADMSKDELADELFRLRMARENSTKNKAASVAKASAKQETKNELPTQSNAHEMPTTGKTPSPAKSKRSKPASAPAAAWDTTWDTPAPAEATKPASKVPSKPASKTPSQKAKEAPGSYPESTHKTPTTKEPSNHPSANNAEKSASKKSGSKKSNKDADAAAAGNADWNTPAAGADGDWGQQAQDATAWDTPAAGNDAWGAGAQASGSVQWGPLRIAITIVGIFAAIAISIAAYYWIKGYVLKAIALFILLRTWIVAPFAWAKRLWFSLTDLSWVIAPFAWLYAFVKKGLMAVIGLVSKSKVVKPKFMELDAWTEWLKRPEWLKWRGGALRVPEVVDNGFEVFMPDGIQAIEDVIEEL